MPGTVSGILIFSCQSILVSNIHAHTLYFFSCIFSKIGLSNNFISLNGFLYNWSLQAIIFPRLCLDSLFNYNPVAMERDGTDLQESRGWVHKVTWEGEESEAAAQLDTGTDAPLPSPCGFLCAFLYFLSQVQHPSLPDIHVDRVRSPELYSLKLWVWLWAERTSYWNWRFIELIASRKPSRKTKSNIYSLRYILFSLKECFPPLLWILTFCALDVSSKWTPSKRLCNTGLFGSLQMYPC